MLMVLSLVLVLIASSNSELVMISKEEQKALMQHEEMNCYNRILSDTIPGNFCRAVWDGISCWPSTPPGQTVVQPCPVYFRLFNTLGNASKVCTADGHWYIDPILNTSWTNYSECFHVYEPAQSTAPNVSLLMQRHLGYITTMYSVGYVISLISLIVAVAIMLAFRRLYCPRNIIHINLFMSFILRASMCLMKDSLLVDKLGFERDVFRLADGSLRFHDNMTHWECKLFFTAFHYSFSANYTWILIEGLYLHMLIYVTVFTENSSVKWFILMGWGAPMLSIIPWLIVRLILDNTYCWNINTVKDYFWILKAPIVLTIVVNFILFVSLVRVLFTKLVAPNAQEAKKYRKLVKSTLVLIPLFGVHYILFLWLPDKGISEVALIVKLYYEMFFNSFQGFFITILFCFMNGEVRHEIRKTWERYNLRHGGKTIGFGGTTLTSYVSRGRQSHSNSMSLSVSLEKKDAVTLNNGHMMTRLGSSPDNDHCDPFTTNETSMLVDPKLETAETRHL
ncbi:secretin receptor-like isoform X2 [Tubulanus polymorphus]|uniref:secretin receptor-like isoform X2 n=1 Tax=Tubulanus polymorphus TaxID=672921 RepID=UPI003DA3C8AE